MFVKICGITSESDALMAVAMGADALGFIFAPSTRQIAPAQARDIARRLPPEILTVGVFRDEAAQRVVEVVHQAGLHGAQLHGRESPGEVRWVRQRISFVVKAFAAGDRMLEKADSYDVDAILLDAPEPGSGQVFDWSVADALPVGARIILAGGLDPDNVAAAIERVRPWGVDVASGVEYAPGQKDVRATRRFINVAKAFDVGDEIADLQLLAPAELARLDPDDFPEEPEVYDWEEDPAGRGGATGAPTDAWEG